MIIEYHPAGDEPGRIFNQIFDPVPEGLIDQLVAEGKTFLSLAPTPWPAEPAIDPVTGEPKVNEETGQPLMEVNGHDYADVNILNDYIYEGEVYERPTFEAPELVQLVAGGATHTISGLPVGAHVIVDGDRYEIEDGSIVLSPDMPAEYTMYIHAWPHHPRTVKVIVNAP